VISKTLPRITTICGALEVRELLKEELGVVHLP
jgi:hypothetical protein